LVGIAKKERKPPKVSNFVLAFTSACRYAEAKHDKMQMVVIKKYCP